MALCALVACSADSKPPGVQGGGGLGSTAGAPSSVAGSEPGFRITAPVSGSTIQGGQLVEWALGLDEHVVEMWYAVDADPPWKDRYTLPFVLNSKVLANGSHRLSVTVKTSDDNQYTDTVSFSVSNPSQRMLSHETNQETYAPSETIALDLTYNEPGLTVSADFAEVDGTSTPVVASSLEPGRYQITHVVGAVKQSTKRVRLRAKNVAGEAVDDEISLELRALPTMPIEVSKAYFVDRDEVPYEILDESQTSITSVSGPTSILTGTPSRFKVSWSDTQMNEPGQLIVKVAGYSGHYVLPVAAGQSEAELELSMPKYKPGDKSILTTLIALLPKDVPQIAFYRMDLHPYRAEGGGAQFTLRWNKPVDLDLSVGTPDGKIVDYQNPEHAGGKLDLDANMLCDPSRDNVENIGWRNGTEPAGTYRIFANLNTACGRQDDIDYEIVAVVCGKTYTNSGTFSARDEAPGGQGREILPPIAADCTRQVSGIVQYKKGDQPLAAKRVPVRARSTDGTLLAKGFTNKEGRYALHFPSSGTPTYRLEVEATWVDSLYEAPRASVAELSTGTVYVYQTPDAIDGAANPVTTRDILIDVSDSSGAFNIASVLRQGLEWLYTARNVTIDPIGAHWSLGKVTPGESSYFNGKQLFVQGAPQDPDEFDDSVIAHELMHYVIAALSRDSSNGGNHQDGLSDPRLAWSEGVATGLGQIALGRAEYSDHRENSDSIYDLELGTRNGQRVPAFAGETSNHQQDGDVSEFLVSTVLWDLDDPANDDPFDKARAPMLQSIFEVLPTARTDRGARLTDFVDFLDGFRCRLDAANPTKRDEDLKSVLQKFPYDFATSGIGCTD